MKKQETIISKLIENNFNFSDLFANFNCSNVDDFIFDHVKLSLSSNTVLFSGQLRMTGALSVFKNYLSSDDSILITGKITTNNKDLNSKIEPENAVLTCTIPFFKEVFTGVTLSKVIFELDINKNDNSWNILPQLTGDFDVNGLTDKDSGALSLLVSESSAVLNLKATAKNLKGAFGINNLNLESVTITGALGNGDKSLDLTSELIVGESTFNFSGEITPASTGIIAAASSFNLTDLSNIFNEISPAGLTLPEFDVDFKNSSLSLATANCTINQKSITKGFSLASEVRAHNYTFKTDAQISTSGVAFDGSLGSLTFGPVDIKKTDLNFQLYKKSVQKPAKFEISGEAVIEGLTLDCGVYFEKNTTYTTVLYANIKTSSFSFSNIFPSAQGTFVNQLKFSKLGFIYASANCTTKNEGLNYNVSQGLQLMGVLEEIPGLSDLTGEKHIGLILTAHFGSTSDITIAIPDTRLDLGHSVTCDPLKIKINILPEPDLEVIFGMDVSVPKQSTPLHFDMSLSLDAIEAKGAVTMKNYWKNPFGIDGLKIGPALAIQIGIIYEQFVTTGIPSEFGIAGGLQIADTTVDMAVSISENPMEEILMGKLEELNPSQLIDFAAQIANIKIPNVPNFFELKELELYCAPDGGSIGTITYQPGFSFSGNLVIGGKDISVYTRVSDSGIEGAGHIDKLSFGPLKISGEKGKDATVDLELTTEKQSLEIDGAISFLGFEEGVYVNVSNNGIAFKFEQNFFGELKFEIDGASLGELSEPSSLDFTLSGEMDNNITSYLKTTVTSKINDALKATEKSIDSAKAKVATAQKAYETVYNKANQELTNAQINADTELKRLTDVLSSTKSEYAGKITDAQNEVNSAKAKYDKAFDDAQNAVNAAEKTYDDGMQSAQNAVNTAERTYNNGIQSAQDAVKSAENKYNGALNSAISAINSASRKVDFLDHWYSYPAYLAAKAALAVVKGTLNVVKYGADYTAFQAAKTALTVAKTGVNYTVFETAKAALVVAKTGVNYMAFESAKATLTAVKDATDYTVWQTALQTLSAVKSAGEAAINAASAALGNIGKSVVYVALEAAKVALTVVEKGTEAVAFDTAKAVLEAAKLGAEGVLKLSAYIASHVGDLIDIKSFKFSGSLKEIEQGNLFNAELDITLIGHDFDWTIDFNVKKVSDFIDSLFTKSLKELKSLVM